MFTNPNTEMVAPNNEPDFKPLVHTHPSIAPRTIGGADTFVLAYTTHPHFHLFLRTASTPIDGAQWGLISPI